jgi:hypothetical protein
MSATRLEGTAQLLQMYRPENCFEFVEGSPECRERFLSKFTIGRKF